MNLSPLADNALPLADAVVTVADWMRSRSIALPSNLAANIQAVKTQAYFQRALWDYTRKFHSGTMDVSTFLDKFIVLVEDQARRAWNEGMRNVGLDPAQITINQRAHLQEIINREFNHVLDYASAIEDLKKEGKPVDQLRARCDLWANRYPNIVNEAMAYCAPHDRYRWQYGDTVQHCSTCAAMNGIVATGVQWRASGILPQSPPNPRLECGGWRCRCQLVPTTDPLTETGIPAV